MATFIGRDETEARELLRTAGVRLLHADSPDCEQVLAQALEPDSRGERLRLVAEPPPAGQEGEGMGAWHVNSVSEFHDVLSGEGILECWTADGCVSVVLNAGDVMVVEGAEHRYLPVTAQEWLLRFGGGADGELASTGTGRVAEEWARP